MRDHPAPLMMSREDHVRQIESYWRQREADIHAGDVLFDEQLRAVAFAMAEPEPSMKLPELGVWVLQGLIWLIPITIIGLEYFRP